MPNKAVEEIFEKMDSKGYDEFNSKMHSIADNLHFLNMLILKNLPTNANVLCVGAGTGADILGLAKFYPSWNFVGLEPSKAMLQECREKIKEEGLTHRCELFQGYLSEFQSETQFDAVLCLFVMHFVKDKEERQGMFQDMGKFLKLGGYLINAEISADMSSDLFSDHLEKWKNMHAFAGSPKEKLEKMRETMEEFLLVLPPSETEKMIAFAGFTDPIQFFQSFLICGWYAQKKLNL